MVARFLLISLNIDAILEEVTIQARRKKLEEMTKGKGLGDAYTSTLTRIKSQNGSKSRIGMEALMWISHSERPLKARELCQALGVERGETDQKSWDIPAIETVLRYSLGLITIEASSSTVRLVHFTLQEHLSHASLFYSPHSMMAEICLTFLNFQCVKNLSTTLDSPPVSALFVGYASCYWGTHARKELSKRTISLALMLLDGYEKHISSKLFLIHERGWWWHYYKKKGHNAGEGFTGLHGAAYLGIVEIMGLLLKKPEWDVNSTDKEGNTPLAWAVRKGNEDIARMLLARKDVNPNTASVGGRTPLMRAARYGHKGMVEKLLERTDVDLNRRDKSGQTALYMAAEYGRGGVVDILVKRTDINPNTIEGNGWTPLSRAIWKGHLGVVKTLLELGDIEPDKEDARGLTPLSLAARDGREAVIKMLLQRTDVNPNTANISGDTPLLLAATSGHGGVVKALLARADVDPNTPNKYGQTPLSGAARKGCEGVVRMLLERDDINPKAADLAGDTALSQAVMCEHPAIEKLLCEHKNSIPTSGTDKSTTLPSPQPPVKYQRPFKRIRRF